MGNENISGVKLTNGIAQQKPKCIICDYLWFFKGNKKEKLSILILYKFFFNINKSMQTYFSGCKKHTDNICSKKLILTNE